jgi:uncharacterized protein YecE (DUF72 family)
MARAVLSRRDPKERLAQVLRPALSNHRDQRHRTPSLEAVRHWRDASPKDFVFAWKGSKFITHWKRLSPACANSIALMETRPKRWLRKLASCCFQLPPRFSKDCARLEAFLAILLRRRYSTRGG